MIRQLREKQNREAEEYNKAINRQVIDRMHSQVALWESERPITKVIDDETVSNYESSVLQLQNILTKKIETVKNIDINNSGDSKEYNEIINNTEFINIYNILVKPLISGSITKRTKSAIENLIQPLMPQINELVIAFRKLVDNNRAVNITNINSILTSFGMYSYLKEQFDKNVYAPVIVSNLQSYYSNKFIPSLGPAIVRRLDEALDEYNKQPNLRKEQMASQVGRLSPEELKGILKLQGITQYPISLNTGAPVSTATPAQRPTPAPRQNIPQIAPPPPPPPTSTQAQAQPQAPASTQAQAQPADPDTGKRLLRYWREVPTKGILIDNRTKIKRELGSLQSKTGPNRQRDLIKLREKELEALEQVIGEFDRAIQVSKAPKTPQSQSTSQLAQQLPNVPDELVAEGRKRRNTYKLF